MKDRRKSKNRRLLRTCRKEMKEIILLQERRDTVMSSLLPRAIRPTHDHVQITPEDHFAKAMARAADLDHVISRKLDRMLKRQKQAWEVVDTLEDSRYRQILMLYYLTFRKVKRGKYTTFRLHTWETVADAVGYSVDHVKRLQDKALDILGG